MAMKRCSITFCEHGMWAKSRAGSHCASRGSRASTRGTQHEHEPEEPEAAVAPEGHEADRQHGQEAPAQIVRRAQRRPLVPAERQEDDVRAWVGRASRSSTG